MVETMVFNPKSRCKHGTVIVPTKKQRTQHTKNYGNPWLFPLGYDLCLWWIFHYVNVGG